MTHWDQLGPSGRPWLEYGRWVSIWTGCLSLPQNAQLSHGSAVRSGITWASPWSVISCSLMNRWEQVQSCADPSHAALAVAVSSMHWLVHAQETAFHNLSPYLLLHTFFPAPLLHCSLSFVGSQGHLIQEWLLSLMSVCTSWTGKHLCIYHGSLQRYASLNKTRMVSTYSIDTCILKKTWCCVHSPK